MSGYIYKYVLDKTGLSSVIKIGATPEGDPYKETIPHDELKFYQRAGARRKRQIPAFLSLHDQQTLKSVRNRAFSLDSALTICGLRVGWSGIIGLIPGFGDLIACLLALWLVHKATKIEGGLPDLIKARMMSNVALDFGIGLIPFVGDFINIAYKANTRNFQLLEKYLYEKYASQNKIPRDTHIPNFSHLGSDTPVVAGSTQKLHLQEL